MLITSRTNARIKQIRALRSRNQRERTGLFFVEGVRLVAEALQTGAQIEEWIVAPGLLRSPLGRQVASELDRKAPRVEVTADLFAGLAAREGPQGIGAVVRQRWQQLEDVHLGDELCWVAIDAVQNPGNLGAIVRTNTAVGGGGVILLGPTTDPYDPAAVRASLGTIFSQRLIRAAFAEFAAWKLQAKAFVVGTSPVAPTEYRAITYRPPPILFMGGERRGLSAEQQGFCDAVVRIPMTGRCDSLNLGVATGILLYEIWEQRMRS